MSTKVFISWSGDLSKRLAEATREWLPGVLQFVKPYFTPEDIEKGARWGSDIVGELESSDIGIICLTKSNTQKPWILFEAGALSKSFDKSRVCTILFDLDTTDLTGPLTIFQHTKFEKSDFKKLVKSINNAATDNKLDDAVLDGVFDMWWPKLEENISAILADHNNDPPQADRSERDMLEEILELSRLGTRDRRSRREIPGEIVEELMHGIDRLLSSIAHDKVPSMKALHYLEMPLMHLAEMSGHSGMTKDFMYRIHRQMEEIRMRHKQAESEEKPST